VSSKFNRDLNDHPEPHPWLEEKVYAKLRQRTVDLVKQSVGTLLKDKQRVSLTTVAAKSKELDSEHRGVSESAILDNKEARAYYEPNLWSWPRQLRQERSSLAGMSSECASGICI
jgi:hypothetical protein